MIEERGHERSVVEPCDRGRELVGPGIERFGERHEPVVLERCDGPACACADGVDTAAVGDREGPGTEACLVAGEAGQVAGDAEEGLAEDVLGVGHAAAAQPPEHRPGELVVEGGPGGLVAVTRGGEHHLEALTEHGRPRRGQSAHGAIVGQYPRMTLGTPGKPLRDQQQPERTGC
ncbi:MAG: hypothetical protein RLZZ272_1054 [Actinomycetota bacterium]|jgi:hypothetical protein